MSFGVVYLLNIGSAILNFQNETGYMPLNMFDPKIRFLLYQVHIMCTTFCSTFEMYYLLHKDKVLYSQMSTERPVDVPAVLHIQVLDGSEPPPLPPADEPPAQVVDSIGDDVEAALRIHEAHDRSTVIMIVAVVVSIVCFSLYYLFSVALIVVGIVNFDKCPAQPNIPIYLIVAGATALGSSMLSCCCGSSCTSVVGTGADRREEPMCGRLINSLASLFGVAWLIGGMVWTIGASPTFDDSSLTSYCDYSTYVMAYVSFALLLLSTVLGCCCVCIIAAVMAIFAK
ncbi:hypothetical protein PRIPAC_77773 [Pristionchus pacificus]|uniref:Uncharacterized protein n=1 Tax=Pristionchus pacificus TaxID=54126 RepID=A0A2A6BVA8_PRIPA|nr:hypothetical protein PRIPAC_77773 [Pristionchus pacificus]|eukprot:PDM69932.1 hypothetical protein PRIPAC_49144 [Pristionchus pacificus]